jgi:hypothetical protein
MPFYYFDCYVPAKACILPKHFLVTVVKYLYLERATIHYFGKRSMFADSMRKFFL